MLAPQNNPYKKETNGSSDSLIQTLIPEKATFELVCEDFWQAQAFHVSDDEEMQVIVEVDYTGVGNAYERHWTGWVLATDIKEPYGPKPYVVSVSAACGLALLKNIPFLDSEGKRPKDWVSLIQVIRICLYNASPITTLWTGYNLFDLSDVAVGQTSGGLANAQTDPLYNTLVHADVFLTDDNSTRTCWDVLETVLTARQLRLSQAGGQWLALRWPEMGGGYDKWNTGSNRTIHIRRYAAPGADDQSLTNGPLDLNVYTDPSGPVAAKEGFSFIGKEEVGVRVGQLFGRSLSKLGDFSQIDNTGLPLGYRVNNMTVPNRFREGLGTDADPYRMVLYGAGDEEYNNDMPSIFKKTVYTEESPEYTKFIKRTFKCRARLTNVRSAKLAFLALRDDGFYLNVPGEGWIKYSKLKRKQQKKGAHIIENIYRDQAGRMKTKAGWFDISIDLGEIDRVLEFYNYYCVAEALDHYDGNGNVDGAETGQSGIRPKVEYQSGSLESEQQGFLIDGIQKTIVKKGKLIEKPTLTITLGDVPDSANPYDRLGSTFRRSNKTTTTLHYLANQTIDQGGQVANLGRTQLTIIAEDMARQTMPPVNVWSGTIYGILRYGAQTVLRIGDIGEIVSGTFVPTPRLLANVSTDYKKCESEVVAPRLMSGTYVLPVATSEWELPDGQLIPVELGTDGSPVPPAETPFTSKDDDLKNKLIGLGILPTTPRLLGTIPALFTPQDPNEPQFTGTGYVGGVNVGTVVSALRRVPFFRLPG